MSADLPKIKIGDQFFKRRDQYSYRKAGEPAYETVTIKGETSRSWIVGIHGHTYSDFKIPKNKPFDGQKIMTQQMCDDNDIRNASYQIGSQVQRLRDAGKLRQILMILNADAMIAERNKT